MYIDKMASKHYNKDHDYDMDESSIQKRIDVWNACQRYEEKIKESLKTNSKSFFENEKSFRKWESTSIQNGHLRKVNKARNQMIAGLTQFMDGLADLKEVSGEWVTEPDFLNIIFMTAFSKSHFYDKTLHWAKAEKDFQKNRNTSLPGGISGNGDEEIKRDKDLVWYSLQYLYRQFEFTRFVPNFEIVTGIWELENELDTSTVAIIDRWYYIHKDMIQSKKELTDFMKGYFFRYNAKMTSDAQAQTLYILNNLFRYSMSKPVGTFEYPPWFQDSTITGNVDGNLPFSKNIVPHTIDSRKITRFANCPIIGEEFAGMKTIPTEQEEPEEFEDKELAKKIVGKKYSDKNELEKDIDKKEVSRKDKGYTREEGDWDQDEERKIEMDGCKFYVKNGEIMKIKNSDGEKVQKIKIDGKKYKVGQEWK